ncbi:hypothetical protein OAA27_00395 [bacterium]|nr:hypothetical protein [bacterium]
MKQLWLISQAADTPERFSNDKNRYRRNFRSSRLSALVSLSIQRLTKPAEFRINPSNKLNCNTIDNIWQATDHVTINRQL